MHKWHCEAMTERFSPHLPISMDDVLIAAQLLQRHRAAGMELLSGDAHLTAQAELAAVGEAGGAVDIDRRTVHGCCEEGGMGHADIHFHTR